MGWEGVITGIGGVEVSHVGGDRRGEEMRKAGAAGAPAPCHRTEGSFGWAIWGREGIIAGSGSGEVRTWEELGVPEREA